jgi:hypothetical protein
MVDPHLPRGDEPEFWDDLWFVEPSEESDDMLILSDEDWELILSEDDDV